MKNKIVTFFKLLKEGKVRKIASLLFKPFKKVPYKIRAWFEDMRLGGSSLERLIPTKYAETGAHSTQSTDYRLLDHIFETYPLKKKDVIVDIGCGEGRILTYLYLRGFKNTKLVGIELDPEITEIAKKRTVKCKNIDVLCANVLDCSEIISEATVLCMSNPFGNEVVELFLDMFEKHCKHNVIIYYLYDFKSREILDKRVNWQILRRGIVRRPEKHPARYTIYKYTPPES